MSARLASGLQRPSSVAVLGGTPVWTIWGELYLDPVFGGGEWRGGALNSYESGTVAVIDLPSEGAERPQFAPNSPHWLLSSRQVWRFAGPAAADWRLHLDVQPYQSVRGADAAFVYLNGTTEVVRIDLASAESEAVPLPDGFFFSDLYPTTGGAYVVQQKGMPAGSGTKEMRLGWIASKSQSVQLLSSWLTTWGAIGFGTPMEVTPETVFVAGYAGIVAVPRSGGTAQPVAMDVAGDVLVHGRYLYWTNGLVSGYESDDTPVGSTIKRLALDQLTSGASPEIIVDCQSNPAAIAIDGDTIYWVNHLDDGDVWRATLRDP